MGGVGEGAHGADWVKVLVPSLDRGQCRAHLISAVCLVRCTRHHGEVFALLAEGGEKQCVVLKALSEAEMEGGDMPSQRFQSCFPSPQDCPHPLFIWIEWVRYPARGKLENERAAHRVGRTPDPKFLMTQGRELSVSQVLCVWEAWPWSVQGSFRVMDLSCCPLDSFCQVPKCQVLSRVLPSTSCA